MNNNIIIASIRSLAASTVLGLALCAVPQAQADLTFTFDVTSTGNALAYTNGQNATFVFTLHDNSPATPVGSAISGNYSWDEEALTDPELWTVAGTGLLGTYTRPNLSGGSPYSGLEIYGASNALKAYVSMDSGTNGLTVSGQNVSTITMFGTFTGLTFPDITGTLPDPVAYFGSKLGTYTASATHLARVWGTTSADFTLNSLTIASTSAIPEPSTYAAFAGAGVLGLAFWRRRRSNAKA